jgi:hypothetical protein
MIVIHAGRHMKVGPVCGIAGHCWHRMRMDRRWVHLHTEHVVYYSTSKDWELWLSDSSRYMARCLKAQTSNLGSPWNG